MSTPIRWGILGPGKIAAKFAQGIATLPDAQVQAVASRNRDRAQAFAAEYGAPTVYNSYEALADDPEVDIIYVANPHPFHYEKVLMCLDHGKPVLCEKPISLNAKQAEEMFAKAEEKGLFLMEAMWTRFLPVWVQVRKWLNEGLIGDIQLLMADFCFRSSTWDPSDRKFSLELGGGALLDIGIYPVALAYMIFGEEPIEMKSTATLGETGADIQSAYLFRYENGAQAILSSSFLTHAPKEAIINGSKGRIRVPLFWRGSQAIVELEGEEPQLHEFPYEATGLQHQAIYVGKDLRAGRTTNSIMPPEESLRIMRMMDRMRAEWGLVYPGE